MELTPDIEREMRTSLVRRRAEKLRLAAVDIAVEYSKLAAEPDVLRDDVAGVVAAWKSLETERERPAG